MAAAVAIDALSGLETGAARERRRGRGAAQSTARKTPSAGALFEMSAELLTCARAFERFEIDRILREIAKGLEGARISKPVVAFPRAKRVDSIEDGETREPSAKIFVGERRPNSTQARSERRAEDERREVVESAGVGNAKRDPKRNPFGYRARRPSRAHGLDRSRHRGDAENPRLKRSLGEDRSEDEPGADRIDEKRWLTKNEGRR